MGKVGEETGPIYGVYTRQRRLGQFYGLVGWVSSFCKSIMLDGKEATGNWPNLYMV